MPLGTKRKHDKMQYLNRIMTLKEHPIKRKILGFETQMFYASPRKPFPVTGKIYIEAANMNLNLENIASHNIHLKLNTYDNEATLKSFCREYIQSSLENFLNEDR